MSAPFTVRRLRDEADWTAARTIRQRVFVEEQGCPPGEEWDAHDAPGARGTTCIHLLGLVGGTPVATARWHPAALDGVPAAKLERFAVLPPWRGGGRGRALVAAALADARAAGHTRLVLHAQAHLAPFYAAFGFAPVGERFWEAGIEHVKMVLTPG
jgi:predicted GNAT family N-acyltransferase